jgi:Fe-S oxidoreductase
MSDQILRFLEIMDDKQDRRMGSIESKLDAIVTDCSTCRPQVVSLIRTRQTVRNSVKYAVGTIFTAVVGWFVAEKL